jgi:L-iditol 2-dehydrogenase
MVDAASMPQAPSRAPQPSESKLPSPAPASDMRCAVRVQPGRIEVQRRPVPVPAPKEVLLAIQCVGICGGELHHFHSPTVRVIGHELAGTIAETGTEIHHLPPGTRVVVDPLSACGHCEYCLSGRPHLCPERTIMGNHVDGGCAEYVAVAANQCFALPDELTWEQATNVHGLAGAIQALSKLHYHIGDTVAIVGAGPQGLYLTQLARNCMGAGLVIVAGRSHNRLDLARRLGADFVFDTREQPLVDGVREVTHGRGADIVLDASGNPEVHADMVRIAAQGGHVIAYSPGPALLECREILFKEVTIYGSTGVTGCMPRSISVLQRGLVDVSPIMSHWWRFEQAQEAWETATATNKGDYIKGGLIVADLSPAEIAG